MGFRFFLFFSYMIFMCLFLNFPSKTEAKTPFSTHQNKLLLEVCKQSEQFKFCMQLLQSKPRISTAKNITTVANYALALTRKKSVITRNFFNRLDGAKKNVVFEECANYFNETIGMLNLDGLEGGTASLDVHYALDNCEYCENVLDSAKIRSKSISAQINQWKKYYYVAYATVIVLEDETPTGP
ncbi:hypothetical protein JCGZ_08348 [Jatropha curcas]|uniref:Pectinesterase inhibitor domain-containing protein n=1 Tax=Jatropha curcas TaxID=180498 RepID=A0A067KK12_JATCU|nr:hypothetical protein JCGZ_08348 [Jatropha curcas]